MRVLLREREREHIMAIYASGFCANSTEVVRQVYGILELPLAGPKALVERNAGSGGAMKPAKLVGFVAFYRPLDEGLLLFLCQDRG